MLVAIASRVRITSLLFVVSILACSSPSGGEPGEDANPSGDPDTPIGGEDAPPGAPCTGKQAQPLDATWTVGGRIVRVHVPAGYDPTRATPLVLNLHGYSGDGNSQMALSRMIATSDAQGFIALHPDGHHSPRGWNGGVCCGAAATSGTDDTAWLADVLDEAESTLCVDTARVYASGMSNGGFMAHRLGCEIAERIAAIAPVAGVTGIPNCNPSRPVAVMQIHGTSDPLIPHTGGGVNGNEPVQATIDRWVANNGCTGAPAQTYQNGDATCVQYGACTGGADVVSCTIEGGGHQWPGGMSLGSFLGHLSNDLDATNAMWAFFAAHPRQP